MSKSATDAAAEITAYALSIGSFYALVLIGKTWPSLSSRKSIVGPFFRVCVGQPEETELHTEETNAEEKAPFFNAQEPASNPKGLPTVVVNGLKLCACTLGIQLSYLCWGVMQETIMTTRYSNGEYFDSSRFLVFANRFIALLVCLPILWYQQRQPSSRPHNLPLYHYSYCSVSNIVSSACQYEALKFVSFPTQVLAKACKMVPVMLMGFVVNGKRYKFVEYCFALCVTGGVVLFKLNESNDAPVRGTQAIGIVLVAIYMVADSFTSNWQSKIFSEHEVSSMQMMCIVNLFSSAFTAASIMIGMELGYVSSFLISCPEVCWHVMLMSVCSAVGQLFIFYTIKFFGPLVFATIQTVSHPLSRTPLEAQWFYDMAC